MPYDKSKLIPVEITDARGFKKVVWRRPDQVAQAGGRVASVKAPVGTPTTKQEPLPKLGVGEVQAREDGNFNVGLPGETQSLNAVDLAALVEGLNGALEYAEAGMGGGSTTYTVEGSSSDNINVVAWKDGQVRIGLKHPEMHIIPMSPADASKLHNQLLEDGSYLEGIIEDDTPGVVELAAEQFRGSSEWSETIDISAFINNGDLTLSEKVDEAAAVIEASRWYKDSQDGGFSDLEQALEDLREAADNDDEEYAEHAWNTIYNLADNDRVWLDGMGS